LGFVASALLLGGASVVGSCALASSAGGGAAFPQGGGTSSSVASAGGAGGEAGAPSTTTSGGGGGESLFKEMACTPPMVMTGFDPKTQNIVCAGIETAIGAAINGACSAYIGWRDRCNDCDSGPSNWGAASGSGCITDGAANDYCTIQTLGDRDEVHLAAIHLNPDVGDDDRFYTSLHCAAVPGQAAHPSPCIAGEAIVAANHGVLMCKAIAGAAVSFVSSSCQVGLGWHDNCSCNGTDIPTASGLAGDGNCSVGTISDSDVHGKCAVQRLKNERVHLFSFNADGDVDDNDAFYAGVACAAPAAPTRTRATSCRGGTFAVGTHSDGTLECRQITDVVNSYFGGACRVYFGWQDSNASDRRPNRWVYATTGGCFDGTADNPVNVCIQTEVGDTQVKFAEVNLTDDADNTMLYLGLDCR
jgi:hypothetical protein